MTTNTVEPKDLNVGSNPYVIGKSTILSGVDPSKHDDTLDNLTPASDKNVVAEKA